MEGVFIPATVWPCWAYALQRIGAKIDLTSEWLQDKMPGLLMPYVHDTVVNTGDILVWKNDNPAEDRVPCAITENGHIIWKKIRYDYHVGVYEGDGYYTDMVVGQGEGWAIPFVIRRCEIVNDPNWIIRREDL